MTDLTARLIARLQAELDDVEGADEFVALMFTRADAANLLRILRFVEAARIETMQ